MRVAVGGITHETNTFAVESTGMTAIDEFVIVRGQEILEREHGVRTYVGGMLAAAAEIGAEVVPTLLARAEPSGTIAADAYASMKAELLALIEAARPVDAVALELHGAGVVDGAPDLEGDLGAAVRKLVGPDVPVVAAFDLHGNVTEAMVEALDVVLPVHLYPYTDPADVGVNLLCTTAGDAERARAHARRVAGWLWANRERFRPETQMPETAMRLARDATEWPVVINDTADNPGGGAPGDATHVL